MTFFRNDKHAIDLAVKRKFLPLSVIFALMLQGCTSAPTRDDTADHQNSAAAIGELEQTQQDLLSRLDTLKQDAPDAVTQRALRPRIVELEKKIAEFKYRPKKTFISPSTREVGYAMYYDSVAKRIEKIGTLEFPQDDGKSVYGELVLSIPIFQDGTIYEQDGGPKVERSSGNELLDKAALRIARRAAPYGAFPKNMRTPDKDDVWVITTRFNFTNIDDAPTALPKADH